MKGTKGILTLSPSIIKQDRKGQQTRKPIYCVQGANHAHFEQSTTNEYEWQCYFGKYGQGCIKLLFMYRKYTGKKKDQSFLNCFLGSYFVYGSPYKTLTLLLLLKSFSSSMRTDQMENGFFFVLVKNFLLQLKEIASFCLLNGCLVGVGRKGVEVLASYLCIHACSLFLFLSGFFFSAVRPLGFVCAQSTLGHK